MLERYEVKHICIGFCDPDTPSNPFPSVNMAAAEKDINAEAGSSSPCRSSSTSLTDEITHPTRFAGQSDLEKVYSRHEDNDVAVVEILPMTDPNVVNWDGPDDIENPLNWPARKKWTNIALLALITTLTFVLSVLPARPLGL